MEPEIQEYDKNGRWIWKKIQPQDAQSASTPSMLKIPFNIAYLIFWVVMLSFFIARASGIEWRDPVIGGIAGMICGWLQFRVLREQSVSLRAARTVAEIRRIFHGSSVWRYHRWVQYAGLAMILFLALMKNTLDSGLVGVTTCFVIRELVAFPSLLFLK